jgi:hypothetical protein
MCVASFCLEKVIMTKAKNQSGKFSLLLQQARSEAQADAATRFSSHLDGLIRHIAERELNRVEIVELLSQESTKLHDVGLLRGESS